MQRPWRHLISSLCSSTARNSAETSRDLPIPGTPTSVTSCAARAEDRHDGVSDELLDGAAVVFELRAHPCVVRRQHAADILGVEPLGLGREADEVDEDDRDGLPLLAAGGLGPGERRAAGVAEP